VDSTTGVQMAYVKQWASRSFRTARAARAALLAGPGTPCAVDACAVVAGLGEFDLAYLTALQPAPLRANYHIWETLVAWDAPSHYGVACSAWRSATVPAVPSIRAGP